MTNNLILQNFYYCPIILTDFYSNSLSLKSVLTVSSEYFLATSILTIALFFVLLPKLPVKYFNKKVYIFSFINYQLNFLAVLILFFYCFLCMKQYFLFLSEIPTFNNSIYNDFTTMAAKFIIGFASIIYLIFIQQYLIDQQLNYFEYYILILTSVLGFCLLCCSNDLLTAYLAIELQGLSFYVLSSFKKNSNYSAESGVKYFIIGSLSTIIFLLGVNLIYGISGSIYIFDFKDLFLWVFSINSFFLSFDYLPKSLEFFQIEKTFNNENSKIFNNESVSLNLKTIFNNFLILKNKTYISLYNGFDFMQNLNQQSNCFDDCLIENISKEMIYLTNNINNSSSILFSDRINFFQLIFSEPRELIISSAFQNLINWFLIDIQNKGVEFSYYDLFLENLLETSSEIDFLCNFKYNWVAISETENNVSEVFSEFDIFLNQNNFINDWSDYLAFRQLSESIDMALTVDIFSNFDPKKAGAPEVFNKISENFDTNSINLKLILEKFSRFGYLSFEDSKFLLNNINKVFENIQFSSNLDVLFNFITNLSNPNKLAFTKYFLFSSIGNEELNFYKKLSSLMVQFSNSPTEFSFSKNFNVLFENSVFREIIFSSRAEKLLLDNSTENQLFLKNYFLTLNKISSYFLCIKDNFNLQKNIDINFDNYFLDYFNKRMSIPVFYLETYYFKNFMFSNNNFLTSNQELSFVDGNSDFEKFLEYYFETGDFTIARDKLLMDNSQDFENFLEYYFETGDFTIARDKLLMDNSQDFENFLEYYFETGDFTIARDKLFIDNSQYFEKFLEYYIETGDLAVANDKLFFENLEYYKNFLEYYFETGDFTIARDKLLMDNSQDFENFLEYYFETGDFTIARDKLLMDNSQDFENFLEYYFETGDFTIARDKLFIDNSQYFEKFLEYYIETGDLAVANDKLFFENLEYYKNFLEYYFETGDFTIARDKLLMDNSQDFEKFLEYYFETGDLVVANDKLFFENLEYYKNFLEYYFETGDFTIARDKLFIDNSQDFEKFLEYYFETGDLAVANDKLFFENLEYYKNFLEYYFETGDFTIARDKLFIDNSQDFEKFLEYYFETGDLAVANDKLFFENLEYYKNFLEYYFETGDFTIARDKLFIDNSQDFEKFLEYYFETGDLAVANDKLFFENLEYYKNFLEYYFETGDFTIARDKLLMDNSQDFEKFLEYYFETGDLVVANDKLFFENLEYYKNFLEYYFETGDFTIARDKLFIDNSQDFEKFLEYYFETGDLAVANDKLFFENLEYYKNFLEYYFETGDFTIARDKLFIDNSQDFEKFLEYYFETGDLVVANDKLFFENLEYYKNFLEYYFETGDFTIARDKLLIDNSQDFEKFLEYYFETGDLVAANDKLFFENLEYYKNFLEYYFETGDFIIARDKLLIDNLQDFEKFLEYYFETGDFTAASDKLLIENVQDSEKFVKYYFETVNFVTASNKLFIENFQDFEKFLEYYFETGDFVAANDKLFFENLEYYKNFLEYYFETGDFTIARDKLLIDNSQDFEKFLEYYFETGDLVAANDKLFFENLEYYKNFLEYYFETGDFIIARDKLLIDNLQDFEKFLEYYFETGDLVAANEKLLTDYFQDCEKLLQYYFETVNFVTVNNEVNVENLQEFEAFLQYYLETDDFIVASDKLFMDNLQNSEKFLKYYFETGDLITASQKLNFENLSEFYGKESFNLSNNVYSVIFKEQNSFKFYEYDEFLLLLSDYVNFIESENFFSDYLPYYLIYLNAYKRNAELSYYLFDIVTHLFNFVEREDFFENSNTNTTAIVSDYKQSLSETKLLIEILQRFELLNEKMTLSIAEARLIMSHIKKILQEDSCDSNNVKLLNNLAHYMKNNFSEDNVIFKHRADILQKTKVFPFLLNDFKLLFKKINEIVFNILTNPLLSCEKVFFLSDYETTVLNIKKLFNIDSLILSNNNIINLLDFDNNLEFLKNENDFSFEEKFENFLFDDFVNFILLSLSKSTSLKDCENISYEGFKCIKNLAIITQYLLFYVVPENNQDSLVVLPKDLSYYQRIDFLDFISLKINLFKHTFRPTRWEFEFLLNELKKSQELDNFKDPILKEKYKELFQNFNSILSSYLNNANRSIKTNIFENPENYKNVYDARQTVWVFEYFLNFVSVKNLLANSNKTCELISILLSNIFWKENIVSQYNITIPLFHDFEPFKLNVDNLHSKSINLSNCNNYSINLIHVVNLFPLFLDWSKDVTLYNSFMFDTLFVELGLLLILVSLFLKLALTPFHLWSPDIYEGSPSSTTFFFVVVSKISIFVFLLKICYFSFYSMIGHWQFYSLFVAISSILLGSVAALKQRKLKSLLAYSSISNMGLILAAFSVGNFEGIKAVFYYFIIYIISGLLIWFIFLMFKLKKRKVNEKYNKDLGDFSLLHESNSVLAYSFVIIIFTIAGIPPMVGFLAKISIFLTLIFSSMNFIAFISIVTSVISTFYYIRILKVIFFENVLVGKLFYPINSKTTIIFSFLLFLMLFLFINPSLLDFFSYKITLFLSKSFY